MAFPSFFLIFLIIVFLVQHHIRKASKANQLAKEAFWEKEQQSLVVRKKDFTSEDYIKVDISNLNFDNNYSFGATNEVRFNNIVRDLRRLSELNMMNFSHMSNSEIRIAYGTANQTIITENEQHFDLFLKALSKYASIMNEHNELTEAKAALELAVSIGSEYSDHYLKLAKIYKSENKKEAFDSLTAKASTLNSINKNSLAKKLDQLWTTDI